MIGFEKGYLCFWDINSPAIMKCEPEEDDREGVVKFKWGSADYCKFTKKEVREWKELGKWLSISGHWRPVEEFIDHHNMLCAEDNCAFGDTPQEALRKYLLTFIGQGATEYDYYSRKNNRFYYLNVFINDKEKWDELTKDADLYILTKNLYGAHEFKMWKIY